MKNILKNQKLEKYLTYYNVGAALFLEGDTSKDIFILVEGHLNILKNQKQISEITEPGDLFGEMSYLLETERTASVVASSPVKALRIPAEQIEDFFSSYPEVSGQIVQNLAGRLKETTQVVHGLREFCDQLPDAVVMTDTNNAILAWNKAAESLHGRTWQEMKGHQIGEVFQNPEEYRQFIEEVQSGQHLTERILPIQHPNGEQRFVSTSTTVLYDGHFNTAGFIFLSRNVTHIKNLEKKYQRIRNWFIPATTLIALLLLTLFIGLPSFSKGQKILDHKKTSFRDRIIKDTTMLSALLAQSENQPNDMEQNITNYLLETSPDQYGIEGILILNSQKEVTKAFVPQLPAVNESLLGSNYSGIPFQGPKHSRYSILSLYRADKAHPMGVKKTELAYALSAPDSSKGGWLIFQLKLDYLQTDFGINYDNLRKINFDL